MLSYEVIHCELSIYSLILENYIIVGIGECCYFVVCDSILGFIPFQVVSRL
jgi:hypothetical protein